MLSNLSVSCGHIAPMANELRMTAFVSGEPISICDLGDYHDELAEDEKNDFRDVGLI